MTYEMKQIEVDPFDIMCGECQENYIEWWKAVTLAELKEEHEYQVAADNSIPEFQKQIMIQDNQWYETEKDFDKWIEQMIEEGYVRIAQEVQA